MTWALGQPAPQFTAQTQLGEKSLSDFAGQWVLLFMHPADFTPVCQTEMMALERYRPQFEELGVQLLGLSVDSVYSHIGWIKSIEQNEGVRLNFPLIADPEKTIAREYQGVDAVSGLTTRGVFLIDPNQTTRWAIFYPANVGRNIDEILRVIKGLQAADEQKKAAPANWQPGEDLITGAKATID